ncbi:MAG: polysaccharide deacetylase family protein [Flavobacteriales bacterium]|nr:polysaccharide deacetylase family protein [Flavobacteriales bacterium]
MSACVFTVDVEDWFHILDVPSTPPLEQWPGLQSDVERNTRRMLDLFREKQVKCTLFFLAWVAERWPHLVREALADGHEVASHGYAHELVYTILVSGSLPTSARRRTSSSKPVAARFSATVVRASA